MTSRNVPRLRFKVFGDEWKNAKISSMYDTIKNAFVGTATPFYTDSENGEFYLESNNVKDGKINEHTKVFINKDFYLNQEHNWLHTNDLVMVQSGHVGHTAIITKKYNNTAAHALIMFKNVKNGFSSVFINNEFQNSFYRNKIRLITTGNTIKHVLASEVKKINLSYPSLKEQQHISDFFTKLDYLIDLYSQKLEQLKKLKRGYLQKMFPQKGETVPHLRFNGFSGKWNKVKLSDYFEYKNGHSLEKKVVQGGQINVINLNSIGMDGKLKDSGKYINNDNTEKLEKNDIIMILSDITHGNLIGITAIIPSNDKYVLNQRVGLLRKQKTKDINQKFVHYLLNSDRKYFQRMCAGMSQLNLSKKDVIDYTFLLPSLEEQIKIAKLLISIDNLIDVENKKIYQLMKQKKAYLQKMFL